MTEMVQAWKVIHPHVKLRKNYYPTEQEAVESREWMQEHWVDKEGIEILQEEVPAWWFAPMVEEPRQPRRLSPRESAYETAMGPAGRK